MNYNNNNSMDPRGNKNMSVPFGTTIGTPASLSYPQQQAPIGTPSGINYHQQQAPGMHMPNGFYAQPTASYPNNGQTQPGFCGTPLVQPTVYHQQLPHQMPQHHGLYPQQVNTHTAGGYANHPVTQVHHQGHHHGQHHGLHHDMNINVYPTHVPLTYKQQKKLEKKAKKQQKKRMGSSSSSSSSSSSDSD